MKAIAAVDSNWGIGYKGSLLQRIPDDMKHFRKMTVGRVVVMGRTTFESLPGREPLKDRINIVLSGDRSFTNEGITIYRSLEELFCGLKEYNSDDIFIIGGASVYAQLLPCCDEAFITRIENAYPADKFLKNLDKDEGWELMTKSGSNCYNGISFSFLRYINKKKFNHNLD